VSEQEREQILGLKREIAELSARVELRDGRITQLVGEALDRDGELRDLQAMRDVLAFGDTVKAQITKVKRSHAEAVAHHPKPPYQAVLHIQGQLLILLHSYLALASRRPAPQAHLLLLQRQRQALALQASPLPQAPVLPLQL